MTCWVALHAALAGRIIAWDWNLLSGLEIRVIPVARSMRWRNTDASWPTLGGAPVTDRGLRGDISGMTRVRVLIVVAAVGLALFLGGGAASASPGGPDPYWWMGPQIRPWIEPVFSGLANWFFNLPLVPYLS